MLQKREYEGRGLVPTPLEKLSEEKFGKETTTRRQLW